MAYRTVDYFAKFSQHAFENTAQNFYMQVVLQNGGEQSGAKEIRCAGSFTIRRDVFDLVSLAFRMQKSCCQAERDSVL
jgi:hypothetical protein